MLGPFLFIKRDGPSIQILHWKSVIFDVVLYFLKLASFWGLANRLFLEVGFNRWILEMKLEIRGKSRESYLFDMCLVFACLMLGNHLSSSAKHLTSKYLAVDKCLTSDFHQFYWQGPDSCLQSDRQWSAKQVPSAWWNWWCITFTNWQRK